MPRPTKYGATVVGKLVEAFSMGCTDQEACDYADISRDTLWHWKDKYPWFSDKIAKAKRLPGMKAKEAIIAAIYKGELSACKWYLDRRDPDFKKASPLSPELQLNSTRQKN